MIRTTIMGIGMLLAPMALVASGAIAQSTSRGPTITAFAGFAGGSGSEILAGLELRAAEMGRVQPLVAASYWWRPTVGCDQLVGVPCDDRAFALEAGAALRLGPANNVWRPFLSARLGGLFYGSFDRGVWDPNVGAGLVWSGDGRVGFRAEARYHALSGGDTSTPGYAPSTSDVVSLQVGLEIRF